MEKGKVMKIETSKNGPKLNLLQPDGIRNQTDSRDVTHVLLDGIGWVRIEPGSFHFYKTAGDKPVPFIQFDVLATGDLPAGWRVEVFPTAIAGLAYSPEDGDGARG